MEQHRARLTTFMLLALVTFARCDPDGQSTAVNTETSPTAPTNATAVPVSVPMNAAASIKPVQIEIYYEALCSDSVNFVKDQLIPVYRKFNKFIDVTFNPFSQGTIKDNTIQCRRDRECDADSIHACAISKISDKDKLVEFLNCALSEGFQNKTVPIEKCVKDNKIEENIISLISKCATDTNETYPLLVNYRNLATAANVTTVPKIIINKNYSELSLTNLKKAVCDKIPSKDSLPECKDIVSGSDRVVFGVLPIFIGVYSIIKMI
ncbi:GILT-like protein 1 [Sipha flava]|nr:GILT-like protein 1 [Sipha flava]